jgi:hypothetical protein
VQPTARANSMINPKILILLITCFIAVLSFWLVVW